MLCLVSQSQLIFDLLRGCSFHSKKCIKWLKVFFRKVQSPRYFSTKQEPKYIIMSEWSHFKNCWKSARKIQDLRDQWPMAKGPLDHVVLTFNFMTIITEDKKFSFIYSEKWNFCSFTIKKKNGSLHFCNKEHEMQWTCKFSQTLILLIKEHVYCCTFRVILTLHEYLHFYYTIIGQWLAQWFPTRVTQHPRVPFTIHRDAAS